MLKQAATLIDSAGLLPISMAFTERDDSGRFFVLCCSRRGVAVYDSMGARVDVLRLASDDSIPTEFDLLTRVLVGPGDSLHLIGYVTGVVNVLGSHLQVARRAFLPHPTLTPNAVLGDGSYVVARQGPTADLIGYPIHHLAPGGGVLRSFGADTPQYRRDLRLITERIVGLSADHKSVWAVAPGRYVLENWDPMDGRLRRRVRVMSDWFEESTEWNYDEQVRPDAVIEGIREDRAGFVWVLLRDADTQWRAPTRANEMRPIGLDEYNATYDWVLEAIDPATGDVLASSRFDNALWMSPGSLLITTVRLAGPSKTAWEVQVPVLQPQEVLP